MGGDIRRDRDRERLDPGSEEHPERRRNVRKFCTFINEIFVFN